jgi:uncharacterized protein (DUF305 family)
MKNLSKYITILIVGGCLFLSGFLLYHDYIYHSKTDTNIYDLGPADDKYDLRFLEAMTSHHQGAVEMGRIALAKSTNTKVKEISQKIIDSQILEIALMSQWKKDWYNNTSKVEITEHSLMRNLGTYDEKFNLRYLNAMIVHHEAALEMCKDALTKSTRNAVLTICNDIISSQSQEISQMEDIRKELYDIKK